jgi:hypothetical protein
MKLSKRLFRVSDLKGFLNSALIAIVQFKIPSSLKLKTAFEAFTRNKASLRGAQADTVECSKHTNGEYGNKNGEERDA